MAPAVHQILMQAPIGIACVQTSPISFVACGTKELGDVCTQPLARTLTVDRFDLHRFLGRHVARDLI